MTLWPRSLFGRLLGVLVAGMLVAQLLSAAINFAERDSLLQNAGGMQQVQRVADVVRLLDSLVLTQRQRIVAVLSVPPLVLSLRDAPVPEQFASGPRALMFATMLRAELGAQRQIRVEPLPPGALREQAANAPARFPHRPDMMGGAAGMIDGAPRWDNRNARGAPLLRTQVQLNDGSWVLFDARLPLSTASRLPWRLALTLLLMFGVVLLLSLVAVRWVTRPLHALAQAAQALGQDIHRAPLPESGPTEIAQAARAFNTMQKNLVELIDGRTRVLTAMSHDLKTPITRLRLRADLLDDTALRERFEADLKEMEAMVTDALDYMRGQGSQQPRQPVDVMALLSSVQRDQQAMGRTVSIAGSAQQPISADAALLRRCLTNLIDNAVLYGSSACVRVQDTPQCLTLRVQDDGPGLPDDALEQVFEPFFRMEASRNRATGGSGLGLPIARNIARMHAGDLVLLNRPEGGLEALLTLARKAA